MNKVKLAVVLGGRSNEKEISLESGRNVINKISQEKYTITPVFLNKDLKFYKINHRLLVQNSTKEIEESLHQAVQNGEAHHLRWDDLPANFDFIFLALHGGEGENGTIQGALEMLKLPYNGSGIFTSGLCMTKYQTSMYLKSKGFDILDCKLISREDWQKSKDHILADIDKNIGYPVISKPNDDGCSVMVAKSNNQNELIINIENTLKQKNEVLLEKFAAGMMELTVGCIGNDAPKALIATQAVSNKNVLSIEEKFLPGAGLNVTPAPLSKEDLQLVNSIVEHAYSALKCKGYARIDCFLNISSKKLYIIDVNTLPGLTPATCIFHQAAELDISPSEFLDIVISLGFKNHPACAKTSSIVKTLPDTSVGTGRDVI